ncbi:MAG: lysylphosphatidylglycerol synthase transmembrane domain-containing protein, partial [Candidatus Zixiibacteriota bacterium]
GMLRKKHFWGLLIAAALLAYSFKDFRLGDLDEIWKRVTLLYLIPVLLLSGLMQSARAFRWRTIVQPTHDIKISRAVPLYASGAALNYVMPALTGQVGRMVLFSKQENLPKTMLFSTFLVETVFDAMMLFGFIFIGSFSPLYPQEFRSVSNVVFFCALGLLVILYVFLAFRRRIERVNKKHLRKRWPGAYIALRKSTLSFSRGVDALRSTKHLARSLGFSLVIWLSHICAVFLLIMAFGMDVPPAAAIVIVVVNTLALLVPITPGNAGTFEIVVITTLSSFGVGKTDAALFAVALHIIDVIPILLLSLPFLKSRKVTLAGISEDEELAEEELVRLVDDPELVMEGDTK